MLFHIGGLIHLLLSTGGGKDLPFPFLPLGPFGGIPQKVSKLPSNPRTVIIGVCYSVLDRRMRRINLARCI